MSRDHYIVDGYNVLYAHPVHSREARRDLDVARAHLVADLSVFAEGGQRTTVVFDGAGNPFSDGSPHHLGTLTVIFSAAGTSADTVIEALAQRYRERGESAVVVTSDAATRDTVGSGTVSVLSSERFVADLVDTRDADTRLSDSGARRVPVARRIDEDVAVVLSRWARGGPPQQLQRP
ncbi:MAG: NYN domain-containing protein [Coriobacteriia bacterium]